MSGFDDRVIAEFRANHGVVGGPFAGAPILLLHTTGARSGVERVSPMMYRQDGDRMLVFASRAGSDAHPSWFHNLVAHPLVTAEVGDETLELTATPLTGAERDRHYAEQAADFPAFAGYQEKTTRVIPVVALTRR